MKIPSQSESASSAVFDTVALNYFLLAGESRLLCDLFARPLFVSRIVYDPDEELGIQEIAMSELSRGVFRFHRLGNDPETLPGDRDDANRKARHLESIKSLVSSGAVEVVDMNDKEMSIFDRLTDPNEITKYGRKFPLQSGEAASIAIAVSRQLTLATDDNDAIVVLGKVASNHPTERIRAILIRAVEWKLITVQDANSIHENMRAAGFWDKGTPFPD